MTKKILLSVVASALLTTSAFAGTITPSDTVSDPIGEEALSLADISISPLLGANIADLSSATAPATYITYEPTDIPAGTLSNPVFKYIFTNLKNIDLDTVTASAELNVFEVVDPLDINSWKKVGANPVLSGTDNNILTFSAIDGAATATNNKKYVIAEAVESYDSADSDTFVDAKSIDTPLAFTGLQGSTGAVTIKAELYSGDSQQLVDATSAVPIINIEKEYSGAILTQLDEVIDSANQFLTFESLVTIDTLVFSTTKKAVLTGSELTVTSTFADFELVFDNNLNSNAYVPVATTTLTAITATNDFNCTGTTEDITAAVGSVNSTLILDMSANTAILPSTEFTLGTSIASGSNVFPLIAPTDKNAGEWKVNGYNAQIPNAAGLSTHDTVLKFTNRSGIDADVFFTIIDPNGVVDTVNSVEHGIANITSNATGKYKVSELLALVDAAGFDKSGSVSIEVTIPATAKKVYGMASFKNVALGQFKDLPVYSNGNSY